MCTRPRGPRRSRMLQIRPMGRNLRNHNFFGGTYSTYRSGDMALHGGTGLYTLKQIQMELNFLSDTTIRTWMDRGLIPRGTKIGSQRLFSEDEVLAIRAFHRTRK